MNPLRVLLVHRDQWHRWQRIDGQFAYDVPEFVVAHRAVPKRFRMNLHELRGQYDLVWWDEGKHRSGPHFTPAPGGKRRVPVAYYCLYPTLCDHIYIDRRHRAEENADLVLLEHDRLERWQDMSIPVRRCAYSVNEFYYRDTGAERDVDVGFYSVWNYNPERRALHEWLKGYCKRQGYRYWTTHGLNVEAQYPALLARTKVVVHINRTPMTRPPRIFDASACGAAVLASRMPEVSGEEWVDGVTYAAFDKPVAQYHDEEFGHVDAYTDDDCEELAEALEYLVDDGYWQQIAQQAQKYVLDHHTWSQRAHELRLTLAEALGI